MREREREREEVEEREREERKGGGESNISSPHSPKAGSRLVRAAPPT